jgi:multidrug transporter EmrE-like cation transporter
MSVRLILIFSCFVAVIADMLLVWWAKQSTHPTPCFILGFVLLNIAGYVWAYTMREGIESALAITFYALATVMGCSFLGVVIFKEPLSRMNAAGMILGLIALVMISLKK